MKQYKEGLPTCLGMYFPFSLRILLRIRTWLYWEYEHMLTNKLKLIWILFYNMVPLLKLKITYLSETCSNVNFLSL